MEDGYVIKTVDEYLIKMFGEFLKEQGIKGGFEQYSKYEDMFVVWTAKKIISSKKYAEFVYDKWIKGNNPRRIVEFGKGVVDSVIPDLSKLVEIPPIAVTPYGSRLKKLHGIETVNGRLVSEGHEVFIDYVSKTGTCRRIDCNGIDDNFGIFMTQQPFAKSGLEPYYLSALKGKTVFLGVNGSIDDKYKNVNIDSLYDLYTTINKGLRNIDACFESTTDEECYLAALKIEGREFEKERERVR